MEIASVLPLDVAGVEARPTRGQPPEEPFRDCLGSAVGRERGAGQPQPETDAAPDPVPAGEQAEVAEAGDGREADAAAGEKPAAQSATEEPEDEPALAAVPPTPVAPQVEATPSPEPAVPVAASGEAGAAEQPPTLQPPPTAEVPPVFLPEEPEADEPAVAVAAPSAQTVSTDPTRSDPVIQPTDPTRPVSGVQPRDRVGPNATVVPDPVTVATSQAVTATPEVGQQAAPAVELAVPTITAEAAVPAKAEPEGNGVQSENPGGHAAQVSQGRFGAERLWGYWLRHGGGGATQAAAASGTETVPVPAGQGPFGEAAVLGREASPWQALVAAAAGGTGTESGAGEAAAAGPDTRAAPPSSASSLEFGNGPANGLARAERAAPPTPRAPTPLPQPPHQIANAVRVAVLRGGDQVTVQLEPAALGKIHVVLVHGDEGVRASFRVENPLTHQSLQADAPLLKQALEARGVNVAHISVELEQGDRQGRDPLTRHSQGRRRRIGDEDDGEMMLDDLSLRPEPWRPWGFEARA